jgi:predicted GNAT family acetyltransferase
MRGHLIDDRPRRACYLTTDATNEVSNAIYERIGYRHEGDMLHIDFLPAGEEA